MSTWEIIGAAAFVIVFITLLGMAWFNGYWTGQRDEARRQVEEELMRP